jgi:hypothetical protein
MSSPENYVTLPYLAQGLSAVAKRLEPKEAAEAAATLIQVMSSPVNFATVPHIVKTGDRGGGGGRRGTVNFAASPQLARGLSAVAGRMEPKEAATTLIQAMSKAMSSPENYVTLPYLAQGLSAVAKRLEPKEAAWRCGQVATSLIQTMKNATNPYELPPLAQALSAVAGRLEPKEAARLCGQAAPTLIQAIQAMSKAIDPRALPRFLEALSALSLSDPLEWESREVAMILTEARSRTTIPSALKDLGQALSAVAERLEPKEAARLCAQAAATLIQARSNTTIPRALQDLGQALSAVAARGLSPQTLVDLLKHPFCVGEARRLVLDQLARHYHRPFADQWEFVDYVQQQKLGLDLTTPPQRAETAPQAAVDAPSKKTKPAEHPEKR